MRFTPSAFFDHLVHKMIRPDIRHLIHQVESIALDWVGVEVKTYATGGRVFLLFDREIGHIHGNGDLHIVFGRTLTLDLLRLPVIQPHRLAPSVAVSFPLRDEHSVSWAASLLMFSYLLILARSTKEDPDIRQYIEDGLTQLPPAIIQLFRTHSKS